MKKQILIIFLVLATVAGFTQIVPNSQRSSSDLKTKNNAYLEILGSGLSYSVNYERLIKVTDNNVVTLTTRVGVGLFEDYFVIPVHVTGLFGIFSTKFEAGFTMNVMQYNNFKTTSPKETPGQVFPGMALGVRFQPPVKGLMFRVLLTPFIDQKKADGSYFFLEDPKYPIVPWGGMSLGYHF